jgi:hypothetical protein
MLVFLLSQYTQKNLEFALTVDRKNKALVKKMTWVQQQRKDKKTTVPSTGIQSLHEGGQGVTIGHWFLSIFSG